MARIVKRTPQEPTKYVIEGKENSDGGRHEAKETYPDIRTF